MAVGNQAEKPRFFIDLLNYNYHIGNIGTASDGNWDGGEINNSVIGLNPTKKYTTYESGQYQYRYFKMGFKNAISLSGQKMFLALLGHDWMTEDYQVQIQLHYSDDPVSPGDAWQNAVTATTEVVEDLINWDCSYNGWSLATFTPSVTQNICSIVIKVVGMSANSTFNIGSMAAGYGYQPAFHADLAVTQRRIMDGVKQKQTKGGSTYSVINHIKPPNWWNSTPFELFQTDAVKYQNSRLGRRSWDVRFSQLQDRFYADGVPNGVFPANELVGTHEADTVNGGYSSDKDYDSETGDFNYNIHNDNSLYSTVYHNTLNGTLPFLFSPSQDNSPGNFAICRFDKPGFQVQQKTYKKFNVNMRINETW